jgi:hypothetical protein
MRRVRIFLWVFLMAGFAGCGATSYRHDVYQADGKTLAARYEVSISNGGLDRHFQGVDLVLADGTTLKLDKSDAAADPSVVGMFKEFGTALIGLGGVALKLLGVP